MRVHHLNCGMIHPPFMPAFVCHVLLVETDDGLVLVDSGYGLADCDDPARIGDKYMSRPELDHDRTALRQIERLGFRREDIRHIVLTHLDRDHVGGISDFPDSQIHVTAAEVQSAMRQPTFGDRIRFRPAQWAHGPKLVEHMPDGEKWRGFAAAKELDDVAPGIVLISLPGHTRGHACIAVDAGHRWVLHCGDAFYHRGSVDGASKVPRPMLWMETIGARDRKTLHDNHRRLAKLYQRHEPDLIVVNAHDQVMYEHARATA